MDFDFIEESSDLHGVRLVAVTLRNEANAREPERKRLMKEARLADDDETHKLMTEVRPPAWYAILDCDACPQTSLVSAHTPAASRFLCPACHLPASVAWVEEHAREKVAKMYDDWFEKESKKKRKEDGAWDGKAKRLHAESVKKTWCKVRKDSGECLWCDEAAS